MRQIPALTLLFSLALGLASGVATSGCGESRNPSEEAGQRQEAEPAAAPQAARTATVVAEAIDHPPVFDGLEEVFLEGHEMFRLRWSPAQDDQTPPEGIVYLVYHLVEPYLELQDNARPIFTSPPGALEVRFANDAPAGRLYVRARDANGNLSEIRSGLQQRTQRPLIPLGDNAVRPALTQCVQEGRGLLCAGEEGTLLRWDGQLWQPMDLGVTEPLHLSRGNGSTFAWSRMGHLFQIAPGEAARLIDIRFEARAPEIPFRQFTVDRTGLRYWIDATGRSYVSDARTFVHMARPLALPGEECRRLRGLAFGDPASFAFCEGGTVYSMVHEEIGDHWLSLTPNGEFSLPGGVSKMIADIPTEGLVVDERGVRRVAVSGWSPLLLVDWNETGVHPMDIPDQPPAISAVRDAIAEGDTLQVATDLGLFNQRNQEWVAVAGLSRPMAAIVELAGDRQTPATRFYVFADGSLAEGRPGALRWRVPAVQGEELQPVRTQGGATLIQRSRHPGFFRSDGLSWTRVAGAAPAGAQVEGFAWKGPAQLVAWGTQGSQGAIWEVGARGWSAQAWLPLLPPPEVVQEEEGDELAFAAPPPLRAGRRGAPGTELPAPEPVRHLSLSEDGRAVAAGTHQIWWKLADGWVLLTTRDREIDGLWLDAGETYVLLEGDTLTRCWRGSCGEEATLQPEALSAVSHALCLKRATGSEGELGLSTTIGQIYRFEAARDEHWANATDPAFETPVGSWVEVASSLPRAAQIQEFLHSRNVLLTRTGEIWEEREGRWILQREGSQARALLPLEDGWGMVAPQGLFKLGEVAPIRRTTEDP